MFMRYYFNITNFRIKKNILIIDIFKYYVIKFEYPHFFTAL